LRLGSRTNTIAPCLDPVAVRLRLRPGLRFAHPGAVPRSATGRDAGPRSYGLPAVSAKLAAGMVAGLRVSKLPAGVRGLGGAVAVGVLAVPCRRTPAVS
jgi:hypothetical protein